LETTQHIDGRPYQTQLFLLRPSIDTCFERFHEDNPDVYQRLVTLARKLKERGHARCGIKMLFEVLRWQHAMKTVGDDFKLNNNYHSRYARLIMEREPGLDGFFETRGLRS
jgi:hypothetical protein